MLQNAANPVTAQAASDAAAGRDSAGELVLAHVKAQLGLVLHQQTMKSAYELAMERLNRTAPTVKLTAEQKRQIADLESRTKARIAERELASENEINAALGAGDAVKVAELQQHLANDRKKLLAELEDKKTAVRTAR